MNEFDALKWSTSRNVARDHGEGPARRDLRRAVIAHPEERERAREADERGGGEDPGRRNDVDERAGDGGGRDARDRSTDAYICHRRGALAVRVDALHERGVRADVCDADHE